MSVEVNQTKARPRKGLDAAPIQSTTAVFPPQDKATVTILSNKVSQNLGKKKC